MIERLAIVGVGLLGGSVAKAVRARGAAREIVGVGRDLARLRPAVSDGAVDGVTTDLQFTQNYADNGKCSVNLANQDLTSMTGITVADNRFGRNTTSADCAIIATRATTVSASNNVWDDNSQPVRVRDGG